ncbi:MAG TPA: MFS transporter [Capillimicrobium sp.]|nr:MFS transporter [Capillimicrobium sp.]
MPDSRARVRRLAASRLLSMTGTDASGVAIGFAMYSQTGSAAWLSLSLLLTIGAGAVMGPLGGWLGDRVPRRPLMIGAELAAAALFAAIALVHTPAALLAFGLAGTAIGAVFGPAAGAAIAELAGPRDLAWANGLVASTSNVGKTVGRLGGGVLIALAGTSAVFVFDALTFLASAALIWSVRAPFGGAVRSAATAVARRGGMTFALRHPRIRLILVSACASTFATAFTMTAEVPLVFELGGDAIALGALTACWGLGMVAGSWHAGRVLHAGNEATGVLAGRLVMAVAIGLVGVTGALVPALLCYVLGGIGGGFMGVAAQSLVLRETPDELRARALGTIDACRNVAFGVGVVGAGVAVDPLGPLTIYVVVGVACLLGCLPVAALVRSLGGVRPLRAPGAAPAV